MSNLNANNIPLVDQARATDNPAQFMLDNIGTEAWGASTMREHLTLIYELIADMPPTLRWPDES